MASASDRYVKLLYQRYKYFAAWLPNTKVLLGDVGVVEGKYFKRKTSLAALGLKFATRAGDKPLVFNDDLTSGLQLHAKAAGEVAAGTALPLAKAGGSIDFASEGAFLFHAMNCYADEIEDMATLGKVLIRLHEKGEWDIGRSVVDTVMRAGSSTILVSNSRDAKLDLIAKTAVEISNLAKPELGLEVNSKKGDVTMFLAKQGLTPLFHLSAFHRSWIEWLVGKPKTIHFGGSTAKGPPPTEEVLQHVAPDLS
jgi:hypothetical protein